jgi:hypothetical protein
MQHVPVWSIILYNNVPFQSAIASDTKSLGGTFVCFESVLAANEHCIHTHGREGTRCEWCHSSPCSRRDGRKEAVEAHGE